MFTAFCAGIVVAATLATSGARAQGAVDATCMMFAGMAMGGSNEMKDRDYQVTTAKSAAPLVESWIESQLAAGKTHVTAGSVFTNGAVFCAW